MSTLLLPTLLHPHGSPPYLYYIIVFVNTLPLIINFYLFIPTINELRKQSNKYSE